MKGLVIACAVLAWYADRAAAQSAVQTAPTARTDTLRVTGELGFVNTSGNTDLTTMNIGERVEWRDGRLTLGQTFSVVYGRSEGETTTSEWRASARGDVLLSGAVSAYGALAFDRNRFAGLARRFEEGAGITVAVVRGVRSELDLEGGISLVQQRPTAAVADANFSAARAAGRYVHRLSDAAHLRQALEVLANLQQTEDVRLNSETALVAPLSRRLALKVSYVIRFDNLPEPGFETTDRLLTTALQLTL